MILALALYGCTGAQPTPTDTGSAPVTGPVDGDTLMVGIPFDPDNVNSAVAPYALSGWLSESVLKGLAQRHVGEAGLTYEPAIAESWEWSADHKTLTYHLRDDIKWDDGTPVTAHDAVFTRQLMNDKEVASNWLGDAKYIASVEAPDDHTVVYTFTEYQSPILLQWYTFRGVLSKTQFGSLDRATLRGADASRDPLANGPFRVAQWKPGEQIILEPNPAVPPDWKPHLDRIIFKIQPEYSTRLLALQRGDLDLLSSIDYDDAKQVRENPRLRLDRLTSNSMLYVGYNQTDVRFQDARVRKALSMSVDIDALMAKVLVVDGETYGRPCIGTISPEYGPYYASDVKRLPFDVAGAKALLDEAGWKDTDADGLRDRDGKPLRIEMLVQQGEEILQNVAAIAQASFKQLGVDLIITMLDPTIFYDKIRGKQYEAMLWSFGARPNIDPSINWQTAAPYNWYGYSNPEVDAAIRKGLTSTDEAEAQAAIREVQAKVYADQPVTFLFWADELVAIDKRFRDVDMDTFVIVRNAQRWWVPEAEQRY